MVGIIKLIAELEATRFIYVVNLDISRDSALHLLKVIILLEGEPHSIKVTLGRLRCREAFKQGILQLLLRLTLLP